MPQPLCASLGVSPAATGRCVCCGVQGGSHSQWLWDGDTFCIQLPSLLQGASVDSPFLLPQLRQPQCPRGCWFPGTMCCPFAGALHRLLWMQLCLGMPGRASLPPLQGEMRLILVAAEAVGRLQEVQRPSVCRLVWLQWPGCWVPLGWCLSRVFPCCLAPGGAGAAAGAGGPRGSKHLWLLKCLALQFCSAGGREVALAAPGVFVWLWWQRAGGTVVCGSAEGCSWCSAFRGLLHLAGGCCSSSRCLPGTCQLRSQELFDIAGEMTALGKPLCLGASSVCRLLWTCQGQARVEGAAGELWGPWGWWLSLPGAPGESRQLATVA